MRLSGLIVVTAVVSAVIPTTAMAVTYSQVNANSAVVNCPNVIDITATCPAGTWLTGGGYSIESSSGQVCQVPSVPVVGLNAPSPTGTGWQVRAQLNVRGRVIAVARCATP